VRTARAVAALPSQVNFRAQRDKGQYLQHSSGVHLHDVEQKLAGGDLPQRQARVVLDAVIEAKEL
jgi:hypothetical protein